MANVTFQSKKSAYLRYKVAESNIQGYKGDGQAIYSKKAVYAKFVDMFCHLDNEKPEDKFIIDKLRKSKMINVDFKEVTEDDIVVKKGEASIVKFGRSTLSAMTKAELIEVSKPLGIVAEDMDSKKSLIESILKKYAGM